MSRVWLFWWRIRCCPLLRSDGNCSWAALSAAFMQFFVSVKRHYRFCCCSITRIATSYIHVHNYSLPIYWIWSIDRPAHDLWGHSLVPVVCGPTWTRPSLDCLSSLLLKHHLTINSFLFWLVSSALCWLLFLLVVWVQGPLNYLPQLPIALGPFPFPPSPEMATKTDTTTQTITLLLWYLFKKSVSGKIDFLKWIEMNQGAFSMSVSMCFLLADNANVQCPYHFTETVYSFVVLVHRAHIDNQLHTEALQFSQPTPEVMFLICVINWQRVRRVKKARVYSTTHHYQAREQQPTLKHTHCTFIFYWNASKFNLKTIFY